MCIVHSSILCVDVYFCFVLTCSGALWLTAVEPASAPQPMIPVVNLWTTECCTLSNVSHTEDVQCMYTESYMHRLYKEDGRSRRVGKVKPN